MCLDKEIKDFLMPEKNNFYNTRKGENFIEKMHNYQYHNKFDLRIDLRNKRFNY